MDVQVSMPPPPPPPPPAFFTETTTVVPPPPQPVTTTTTTTTTVSVASPPTQDRIWLHPWTVNEMREHASQWSLAGDAGVLLYLEQFSDRLTQRADAIHQHLNQTIDAVKSTHTRVLNCLNEFTSLANTQFIENRVYDEDETANTTTTGSKKDEQTTDKTNVNNTEAQEKVLQRYVEAIQYGLAILDTHFERVEPKLDNNQNGGSSFVDDDEDGGIPLEPILEPKDPYISRPLPHLIGTPEFMQDDYVGLGDLLTLLDEDGYEVEQIAKVDSDSALSSSDEEEEEEPGEQDFQAQISPAPLVPAGASRSDLANRPPPPPTTILTDSDDDDDDPFGINKNIPKINNISSKQPTEDDNLFDDEPKPSKKVDFAPADSDKEDNLFDNPTKKPQSITVDKNDSSDDESSASSKESDEPEVPKKKVKSELELAVERRRKAIADPVLSSGDEDDDELVKKPTKPSNETISSLVNKPKSKPKSSSEVPSSSTILNLTSQPLTKPKSSIFGEHDDDDDLFSDAPKLATTISSSSTTTTKIDTKLSLKTAPKKEKDMFDEDSDEYDDPFSSKKNTSTITKKNEPIPKVQPTIINKPKPIIHSDDSEEDTIFGTKSTPIVTEKNKPHSSDDELFPTSTITKLQPQTSTKSTKLSEDEEPLFIDKSPVKPVISSPAPAPVVVPSVPKPKPTVNEDSDDEILGISKKPPQPSTTGPQKVIAPTKPDDDDDDLFGKPPTTSNLSKTEISKVIPSVNSDEDDILLPPKPTQLKLPPPVNLPPLPSPPSTKLDVYKGPLGIQTPVQSTPQSPPIKTSSVPVKQKLPDDDSDEDSTSKPSLNPLASEGNKKLSVKDLALGLKIPTGAHKPGVRRKASSITEEPPKPSVDDDQPIQNVEPPPTPVKKITKLALDSDDEDDDLFSNKKKTPTTPIVEPKDKTNIENETGKNKIKDLSSRITIKPMMPGARPPPISNESNNATHTTSNEASKEEPIVDKAMLNILKDRAKGPIRTRAAPTRKARPTGAAAAAISTDENDDLFASPKSTNTIPSSPPASAAVPVIPPLASAAVPVIPPPASAAVPVIPPPSTTVPPPVPVTGLLDKTAAIAAISDKQTNSKEKKKFSLFDSDDSDIDELLFGFSKKTKSPVVSKPTATSKATTKSSILPLDDDNDDFLAKRPIKKNTKPVDNDDIFADVKGKDPQINKAKKDWSIMGKSATAETDDIFNDTATKTSAKPKPTATKNKTKNFDDLFDDPLNISSKS